MKEDGRGPSGKEGRKEGRGSDRGKIDHGEIKMGMDGGIRERAMKETK